TVWTSTSEILNCFSSASSCSASSASGGRPASSATNYLTRADLLRVDLLQRPALLDAGDLPLGRIGGGDRQPEAELVRDRHDPLRDPLELRACRAHLEGAWVEQAAGQPIADRAPHVLLDHPRRWVWQPLALVDR